MFSAALTDEQQRHLVKSVTKLLSLYKHISDSYVIEFFSENLWESLPSSWQDSLDKLSPPQIADLLLDKTVTNRGYPSVWPLSLLAFRASTHALAYPRVPTDHASLHDVLRKPEEFQSNHSQSALLGHIFRKHVKPKKQHEIRKLGMMVKNLCKQTNCTDVVDVGSGQGHLTRFLSFGLGLSVTAIEADANLVSMARKFDGQLHFTLEKERCRKTDSNHQVSPMVPGPSPHHIVGWIDPKASWEDFVEQLNRGHDESETSAPAGGPCKKRQWISMSATDHQPGSEDQCLRAVECDSSSCAGTTDRTMPVDELTDCPAPLLEILQAPDSVLGAADLNHTQTPLVKRPCRVCPTPCSGQSTSCFLDRTSSELTVNCPEEEGEHVEKGFVLTGLHACGDLSATLLRHFVRCPRVQGITSVACCYMKITTKEAPSPPGVIAPPPSAQSTNNATPLPSDFGYPMSEWVRSLLGHELSYKAREGACHAVEDYVHRLREESDLLKTHCYRAVLETVIRAARPDLRRAGIQTIKKAHMLPFHEYARLGLPRVGLPADLPIDQARVEDLLCQQGRVVAYFSLVLLLAPVVETLVLLDRMLFLQEQGIQSQLVPLFDPAFSPRNLVLVAVKKGLHEGVKDTC